MLMGFAASQIVNALNVYDTFTNTFNVYNTFAPVLMAWESLDSLSLEQLLELDEATSLAHPTDHFILYGVDAPEIFSPIDDEHLGTDWAPASRYNLEDNFLFQNPATINVSDLTIPPTTNTPTAEPESSL